MPNLQLAWIKCPVDEYENVSIRNIKQDSLGSTFLIWVKKSVANHYHNHHIEGIYVLSGKGQMNLDDKTFPIRPGDYVLIPMKAVHGVRVTSKQPLKVISIQSPKFTSDYI